MAYVKRLVCLAISYKTNGRCIAGREIIPNGQYGGWIRPVGARATAEVSFSEYKYQDNTSPKLLDIIDVPLLEATPHNHQTENHVIDTSQRWIKTGAMSWDDLEVLTERPESLWINSDRTSLGDFNCISPAEAATQNGSLFLIKSNLVVEIGINSYSGKRTTRASFDYKNTHYNFSLTDPAALAAFAGKGEGDYPVEDSYLCVSLTEPFEKDGRCHKLVAAIICKDPL